MTGKGPNLDYLDELLFAKFAELDQKVALLREEMDSIALLLERRKRARDSALSELDQIISDADRLPLWSSLNPLEVEAPIPNRSRCSRRLAFGAEAEDRLYDADFPSEHEQLSFRSRCNSMNATTRSTSHPYSRPTNNERTVSSIRTGRRSGSILPPFVIPNLDEVLDSPRYRDFLADFEDRRVRDSQPVCLFIC
ncbi:hypothetical protein OESDEN_01302 [Oesophagostomum dentatum]|uniref:Uncharacterized protein n=1 Tax=Oesophagostomum dentatum TaxID=61180 RepID=A0A0B1TMG1_OESDE|nr:hypothetical protein OESDEN_01302 [Oesophagostomum dentatum]